MTPSQHGRYWRDWGRIRKLLMDQGEFSAEDADAERHEIHRAALGGRDKSSKDLNNRDLDKIFDAFEEYLILIDGPKSKKAGPSQACRRLIWAIDKLELDAPYLAKIAFDQFGTEDWRGLPEEKLKLFRMTATARSGAKKRAAKKAAGEKKKP